ncbi:phosphatidate cytidylyltransferase [Microbacterium sp. G2-8]|uniref:phosphatidate cytidylyltransferase n=1 Tax=Microbacterium sp. G2-8 TaxID=2842454 RepID=UPI001C8AC0E3|nr:phosphatidate cytidylyltransferase [Microbacterium sp. G2-8]
MRDELEHRLDQARDQFEATNERIKNRTGRDLFAAIGVGVIAGGGVLASLLFVKWVFAILAVGIAALGVFEFARALQARGRRIDIIPQLIGTVIIITAAFWFPSAVHWTSLFMTLALVIVWRVLIQMSARDGRIYASIFSDIIVGCFIPLYVPFLASSALVLARQDDGELWVLAFLLVVVAADTAAYASGLAFGRHKLAPRISPGKTWEGFAGAVVVSAVAGALTGEFMLGIPWWAGVLFAFVIVGSATMGDLGESMIKRDLGLKDMSSWLPGHGGVLDRLDSILPSAVFALALFHLLSPLGAA